MKSWILLLSWVLTANVLSAQVRDNMTDGSGRKQGHWTAKYPGGSPRYEGNFTDDQPTGIWKRYHENGKVKAVMTYGKDGRCFAELFDEDGQLYAKGVFEGTVRDSTWNFYSGDKVVQKQEYSHGKKEGKGLGFSDQGAVIWEKQWKNDQLDGKSSEYYPDGKTRNEIWFAAGKREGKAQFFDESGQLTTKGSYKDDLSDGEWTIFDKSGKVAYQLSYRNGNLLNKGSLDSLQMKNFKQYDRVKGHIPEPKVSESGFPENR
ncbi:MAG: toxin-antitoxin system YwqK family antitoxin [Marinilabiliales bacterium]|nr:toxin-antitoxin system YwqK family antitoxin [Marinilabiliales bacterium]